MVLCFLPLSVCVCVCVFLCWVFVVHRLSLAAASKGYSWSPCTGFSLWWLLLWTAGSRVHRLHWLQLAGSEVVAQGLSSSVACGILPDQGLNRGPLNQQADSYPVYHQGSPCFVFWCSLMFWTLEDIGRMLEMAELWITYSFVNFLEYSCHPSAWLSVNLSTREKLFPSYISHCYFAFFYCLQLKGILMCQICMKNGNRKDGTG